MAKASCTTSKLGATRDEYHDLPGLTIIYSSGENNEMRDHTHGRVINNCEVPDGG